MIVPRPSRWVELVIVAATFVVPSVISSGAARADIGLCGSFPAPSSDANALRQAPFAFDGVAVDGRDASDEKGGVTMVSPLTFRVTGWLKRGSASVVTPPSGAEEVHLWDGRYARLADRLLKSYSEDVATRFHGEIQAFRGQAWRIYGTNENGVNFTCTNLLGSHPLLGSESASPTPPRPSASGPLAEPDASSRTRDRSGLVGLALLGAGVLAVSAWLIARGQG